MKFEGWAVQCGKSGDGGAGGSGRCEWEQTGDFWKHCFWSPFMPGKYK